MNKLMKLFLFLTFSLGGCNSNTTVNTGPFIEAGPASVSVTVDNNGVISLNGAYQQTLIGNDILGAGWEVGFQKTLNKAQQITNTLFILYDESGVTRQLEYNIAEPFEVTFTHDQWVQKVYPDGNGNIVMYVRTQASTSVTQNGSQPTFNYIEQTETDSGSQLVINQDVFFSDPDGDAYLIEYGLISVSANIPGFHFENDNIKTLPEQQIQGTYKTITWECGKTRQIYDVTLQAQIVDRAGNRSVPFSVVFKCH
jgi:hypothetical protein